MTRHAIRLRTLAALAMTLAFGALLPSRAAAQISPGPLARAHSSLEGAANCANCHGLRREPMSQMCLSCHKEVQWLLDQKRGYHPAEVLSGKKACASCHPDHAGIDFALIAWPEGSPARFDHRKAGWLLEGKHTKVACDKCHTSALRVSPVAALSKRKTGAGWVGLETSCASCHRGDDQHKGALGASCEKCHDASGWKPAPKFDHARTDYPLTGKHADVTCEKCHLSPRLGIKPNADGAMVPVFKPVPFAQCSSCHVDPHKGRFSTKCSDCHVTTSFAEINRADFDHSRTRYPLDGKHRVVKCDACHGPNLARRNPPFATCASCHTDAHRGEATLAGKWVDCASCHRVQGFTPSTFTVAQHQSSAFTLVGKHQQVRCSACHSAVAVPATSAMRAGKVVSIRPPHASCASCHADAHGGQLASRGAQGTCESCHSAMGWAPSTYTVAQHATLRLPLDGRHATISCTACHGTVRPGLPAVAKSVSVGTAHVVFAVAETDCASCHADPHNGRYARSGAVPMASGCRSCHGTQSFRPSTLDVATHARFSFALEGAHRATPCVSCHVEMKATAATSTLVLAPRGLASLPFTARRSTACVSCHVSPHGDQFASRKDRGACESCHGVTSFASAERFDHRRDTTFPLEGAHAQVKCASCHRATTTAGAGAKPRIVYRGLSGKCESCHTKLPGRLS